MPIYDYTCSACGHLTEVIHGINDHGPRFCPECGAEGTMSKGFATPAIHFKGTGWAKKDRGSSARSASKAKDEGTKDAAPAGSGTAAADKSSTAADSTSSPTSTSAPSSATKPD